MIKKIALHSSNLLYPNVASANWSCNIFFRWGTRRLSTKLHVGVCRRISKWGSSWMKFFHFSGASLRSSRHRSGRRKMARLNGTWSFNSSLVIRRSRTHSFWCSVDIWQVLLHNGLVQSLQINGLVKILWQEKQTFSTNDPGAYASGHSFNIRSPGFSDFVATKCLNS